MNVYLISCAATHLKILDDDSAVIATLLFGLGCDVTFHFFYLIAQQLFEKKASTFYSCWTQRHSPVFHYLINHNLTQKQKKCTASAQFEGVNYNRIIVRKQLST